MPFVMMGLWTAVAAEGPVGRFGQREFVSYFLGVFVTRIVTGSWMVWELTMDIRQGTLAARLLRPLHPLVAYSAEHLSAVPLRLLVVVPPAIVLAFVRGEGLAVSDPARLAILVAALMGAWWLFFLTMVIIGTLALFIESALSVFELWFGIHSLLSGYLVPLELLPPWVASAARHLPFRYIMSFPVETLIGLNTTAAALADLGVQWLYVAGFLAAALALWRVGMRRFGG
jgi:ABC-2 type transport system permease protein